MIGGIVELWNRGSGKSAIKISSTFSASLRERAAEGFTQRREVAKKK